MGPLEQGRGRPTEHGHDDHLPARRRDLRGDRLLRSTRSAQRLREMAFLTRGLRIELIDERAGGERVDFQYEGGIRDFIAYVNESKDPVHKDVIYFDNETDEGEVEVAMQWNSTYVESTFSFANNINTHEGGTHLSGFKAVAHAHAQRLRARTRGCSRRRRSRSPATTAARAWPRSCRSSCASRSSRARPRPSSATRRSAASWRRRATPSSSEYLEEHPNEARAIVNKLIAASRARQAARKARDADPPQVGARRRRAARQAGRLLAVAIPMPPSCTWSRATAPAAAPSTRATAASRRSCRCAARSSTSRRRASTRCSPTTRSRP